MRVHIATDHAGLDLSRYLVERLTAAGHELVDHGPAEYDALDDYPAFCIAAALAVRADREQGLDSLGIVLGGSGNGEQIAANKVGGIRAALAWNLDTARLARQHNDAQVVAVGGRQHSQEEALAIVTAFLDEPFSGDERHVRRIGQIAEYETTGTVAGRLEDLAPRTFPARGA
ncbi:ribose-5-phosphate isomerase [Kocuria flava]|uniref:ribose-5-phosphate isomerase n=1 Tax=Kocuria flava TaxID=446860 RepID=UPI001FF4F0F6|nr:ribose-5-phosphate isomerase [Kocuria flava]MCJ8505794.1 ribose-5-phosphate isomerase [Kocuria flava]